MSANDKQIGGDHYAKDGEQHWDRMFRLYGRGYFVGCATKYIERYHKKNGRQDLEKAIHFLEKLIELEYGVDPRFDIAVGPQICVGKDGSEPEAQGYVNQDGPLNADKAFTESMRSLKGTMEQIAKESWTTREAQLNDLRPR